MLYTNEECHAHGEAGIYIQIATKLGGPFEAGGWDEKKEPRMKKRRGREGWERCGVMHMGRQVYIYK